MQNTNRKKLLFVIGGIWLFLMLLNSLSSNAATKTLPYSEFLKLAKEGKISEVAVTDNVIQGIMLDENSNTGRGEPFRTVRVDPDVSEIWSRCFQRVRTTNYKLMMVMYEPFILETIK